MFSCWENDVEKKGEIEKKDIKKSEKVIEKLEKEEKKEFKNYTIFEIDKDFIKNFKDRTFKIVNSSNNKEVNIWEEIWYNWNAYEIYLEEVKEYENYTWDKNIKRDFLFTYCPAYSKNKIDSYSTIFHNILNIYSINKYKEKNKITANWKEFSEIITSIINSSLKSTDWSSLYEWWFDYTTFNNLLFLIWIKDEKIIKLNYIDEEEQKNIINFVLEKYPEELKKLKEIHWLFVNKWDLYKKDFSEWIIELWNRVFNKYK